MRPARQPGARRHRLRDGALVVVKASCIPPRAAMRKARLPARCTLRERHSRRPAPPAIDDRRPGSPVPTDHEYVMHFFLDSARTLYIGILALLFEGRLLGT